MILQFKIIDFFYDDILIFSMIFEFLLYRRYTAAANHVFI